MNKALLFTYFISAMESKPWPDLLMNTLESFSWGVELLRAKVLSWSQIEFTFTEGLPGERHGLGS